jgi:hypothetical protein
MTEEFTWSDIFESRGARVSQASITMPEFKDPWRSLSTIRYYHHLEVEDFHKGHYVAGVTSDCLEVRDQGSGRSHISNPGEFKRKEGEV